MKLHFETDVHRAYTLETYVLSCVAREYALHLNDDFYV